MFVPIHPDKMTPGKKYKIGTATGIFVKTWASPDGITYYKFFDLIHANLRRFRFFTYSSTFYEFVSDNPQGKMEQRSVNLVVQKLTGDKYFEW